MSAVCVYCASGPVDQPYLDLAAEVGRTLAEQGHVVVSGGGNISMMGALVNAAREAGGHTVGIIPRALMKHEVADLGSGELVVTETMRERKRLMDERADGFITLPGGIGTLEELFETWTGGYLGMHDKPVVLLDPVDFYAPLLDWLRELSTTGFVARRSLDRLLITRSVADAVELATARKGLATGR
ncbi:TIGR00730 family Rossman fold protein [Gordonia hongkongensis]|uniref:Cytokinin riboside 5'-monophosphate phosphoribohydrolase n=1 Tax=Gordonia hongkongensis TaxID=1701090 RepID=A0AAX3T3G8_9ACTN|nr:MULTISPECIES: TIGR00730 family Rossman fold protein [Gordonia]OCW84857.1 Rossman fold protein, TIGR00730 family [Nocardia farcinica]QIK47272.1 TIGR00730 family Rossman fold protein [Gordonia terrae]MBR7192963.1 TIGR00730 family Rossman fold protein [Gordonia sp. SCSIO 19800]MCX2753196.1 TIGR00730 family Rossman fold protein [Gordonia sp. 4N]WFP23694.1 TIGR00730 family Rossman fold protein [Gordonia hongkongensis]